LFYNDEPRMQVDKTNIKTPLFFDHDGAIDDIVSLVLLLTFNHLRISGISITNGAGNIESATDITTKILHYIGKAEITVALSSAEALHPFPEQWRESTQFISSLSRLKLIQPDKSKISQLEGSEFMAKTILVETEKTTILLTGPATNLVNAIEHYPELADKIDKVIWMAGAFLANGNVIAEDHDGSAEWNIFWDPVSAQKLVKSGLKIQMFPIDVCQLIPLDNYLMFHLQHKKNSKLCQLVYQILKPMYDEHRKSPLWDVVATSWIGNQDLFRFTSTSVDIETRGTSTGSIYRTSKGGAIKYANWIDDERFYNYLIEQLSRF